MKQGYAAPVHVNYDNDRRRSLGYRPLWNVQSAQALPPRRRRYCRRRRWQKEREQTLRPQDMARPLLARPPPARRRGRKSPFSGTGRAARQSMVGNGKPSSLVNHLLNCLSS